MTAEEDREAKKVKMTPRVKEALENISRIGEEQVARMSEQVFKERILPIFVEPNGNLDTWVEFTGSLQRPIDVMRDGTVLFRCPSPLRALPTSVTHTRANSFNEILAKTETLTLQHPLMGMRYMEGMIAKRDHDYDSDVTDERQQWINIMARYGYVAVADDGTVSTATASAPVGLSQIFSDQDEPL